MLVPAALLSTENGRDSHRGSNDTYIEKDALMQEVQMILASILASRWLHGMCQT